MTSKINNGLSGLTRGVDQTIDGLFSIVGGLRSIGDGLLAKSAFLQLDNPNPASHLLHECEDPETGFVIVSDSADGYLQTTSSSAERCCIHMTTSGSKPDSIASYTTANTEIFDGYFPASEEGLP